MELGLKAGTRQVEIKMGMELQMQLQLALTLGPLDLGIGTRIDSMGRNSEVGQKARQGKATQGKVR